MVNAVVAPKAEMPSRNSRSAVSRSSVAKIAPIAMITTGVAVRGCR
jgi:hypothetical protein